MAGRCRPPGVARLCGRLVSGLSGSAGLRPASYRSGAVLGTHVLRCPGHVRACPSGLAVLNSRGRFRLLGSLGCSGRRAGRLAVLS